MKVSTGKVGFPIEFDNGDKEIIYFNPNDRGIQERIQNFEKSLESRIKAIDLEKYKGKIEDENVFEIDLEDPEKLFEMSAEELKTLQDKLNVINDIEKEYNDAIKSELDVVFNGNISNIAFKYCEPFDTVIVEDENGNEKREIYIMHFMRWLTVELKKYGEKNKSAMNKHIAKYVK